VQMIEVGVSYENGIKRRSSWMRVQAAQSLEDEEPGAKMGSMTTLAPRSGGRTRSGR